MQAPSLDIPFENTFTIAFVSILFARCCKQSSRSELANLRFRLSRKARYDRYASTQRIETLGIQNPKVFTNFTVNACRVTKGGLGSTVARSVFNPWLKTI